MSMSEYSVKKIRQTLKKCYPKVETQLFHRNVFELLIATILSAQCTDRQVNAVTPVLFQELKTPDDFIEAPIKKIEKLIHSTGFFHNKAKNIKNCCQMLVQKYNGKVPDNLEKLIQLPGVGRKTANVVLGAAFGKPAMVVDTHVSRISQRLGMTDNKNPKKIEFDLMDCLPKQDWNDFSLHLIHLGRQYCRASKPDCINCPLAKWCQWNNKNDRSGRGS
ncbi:endonuclease III [Candidatus Magnetomorum sp. HK-1]|nr:endonuclease III [Candidatus Magnetomorum sp. HK-1]